MVANGIGTGLELRVETFIVTAITSSSTTYVTGCCMPWRPPKAERPKKPKKSKKPKGDPVPPWLKSKMGRDL